MANHGIGASSRVVFHKTSMADRDDLIRGREPGMKEQLVRLGPRERQITELLLQGCDNAEIAKQLKMARRTVKAHFNRLFLRFGISGGIKRVKLATLLYRRQLCSEASATESVSPVNENNLLSNSLLRDSRIGKSQKASEPPNMSSRTTCASSTTNSGSGTGLNSRCGTKPDGTKEQPTLEAAEHWEQNILDLDREALRSQSIWPIGRN
jgi:DNA-binding CsgD family transcriptional regulator